MPKFSTDCTGTCALAGFIVEFIEHYVIAALWYSNDNSGKSLYSGYTKADIAPGTMKTMQADCREFFTTNKEYILYKGCPDGSNGTSSSGIAGYDFWLTRNYPCAGFSAGHWPEPHGEILARAARMYKKINLYVGKDGKIHAGI